MKKKFNMSFTQAAKELELEEWELNQILKENHFNYWPYEKLKELNRKLMEIKKHESADRIKISALCCQNIENNFTFPTFN